jgi:hypothetical protein
VKKEDHICALYELPIVNNLSVPLIGELVEIRFKKAQNLIQEWFAPLLDKVSSFKVLTSKNIKAEKLELVCEEALPILIIGAKQDLSKASHLFSQETIKTRVTSIMI